MTERIDLDLVEAECNDARSRFSEILFVDPSEILALVRAVRAVLELEQVRSDYIEKVLPPPVDGERGAMGKAYDEYYDALKPFRQEPSE